MEKIFKAAVFSGSIAILFSALGYCFAGLLDLIAPGYYPGVFPHQHAQQQATNTGQLVGGLQGLGLGFVVGILLATAMMWFEQMSLIGILRACLLILIFTLIGAILGGLVGLGVGIYFPDYYIRVVSGGNQPNFKPEDVGIGLGSSQGLMIGAIIGTIIAIGYMARQWWLTQRGLIHSS